MGLRIGRVCLDNIGMGAVVTMTVTMCTSVGGEQADTAVQARSVVHVTVNTGVTLHMIIGGQSVRSAGVRVVRAGDLEISFMMRY